MAADIVSSMIMLLLLNLSFLPSTPVAANRKYEILSSLQSILLDIGSIHLFFYMKHTYGLGHVSV